MAWNPQKYNQFKSERFQPFFDCLDLVISKPQMEVIDLGCGTGELTRKLFDHLPAPKLVCGIDSSEQMLKESQQFSNHHLPLNNDSKDNNFSDDVRLPLQFQLKTIEAAINEKTEWDLIFSNAAIQWVADHRTVLPGIITRLKKNGQLVIQMPAQHHNITNQLLEQLATADPFKAAMQDWTRGSHVLDISEYASILFANGGAEITVFEKIYPVILKDVEGVHDWVSGTALLPYLERLSGDLLQSFITQFKAALSREFPGSPVFYPFRRMIMSAVFPKK